jgi:hypothetical protein
MFALQLLKLQGMHAPGSHTFIGSVNDQPAQ